MYIKLSLGECPFSVTICRISFNKLEDVNEVERQRQDELDIKCLQILRAVIHNEIMLINPTLKERNPASYRK